MTGIMMRAVPGIRIPVFVALLVMLVGSLAARPAHAQDPPPRIGPFVIDLHGTVPRFPSDDLLLARSRGMTLAELPGSGLGLQVGAHLYLLRWRAITFGVGGEFAASRARQTPAALSAEAIAAGLLPARAAEERFTTIAPQLSFNFGTGHGWSYISGGLGQSTWSIVPEGQEGYPPDADRLKTINYGGGARWFAKPHLAFSFDVRFYAINPGSPFGPLPGTPRTRLLVIGAGVSVK
jgi:hypothetical protein